MLAWCLAVTLCLGPISAELHVPLAASLAQHLRAPHCVIVSSSPHRDILNVKTLSARFIYSVVVSPTVLSSLASGEEAVTFKTLVALDDSSLLQLDRKKPNLRFSSSVYWLVDTSAGPDLLEGLYVPFNSSLWLAQAQFNSTVTSLTAFYQFRSGQGLFAQPYGTYSPLTGLQAPANDVVLGRRDFYGLSLAIHINFEVIARVIDGVWWIIIAVLGGFTCLYYGMNGPQKFFDPCVFDMECIHYIMWQDFSKALNFTVDFVLLDELISKYDKKFDGRAAIASFHILDPQAHLIAPTFVGKVNLYIPDTGVRADTWGSYFRPFSPALWLTLAGWLAVCSAALVLIHRLLGERRCLSLAFTPLDALSNQGQLVGSGAMASRVSVLMPRVMAVIIFPAYAAAVISFIAVHLPAYPFTDIRGFREDGTYRLGSLRDSFSILYIQNSKSWEMQEIANKMTIPYDEMPLTFYDGILRMCAEEKFAFLGYNSMVDRVAPCPVLRIPTPVTLAFAGLPIARDFPYKPIFQMILLHFYSNGLVRRNEKWLTETWDAGFDQSFAAIEVYQIAVPLLILAAGVALAVMVSALEMFNHNNASTSSKNKRNAPRYPFRL